jgi:putative protease
MGGEPQPVGRVTHYFDKISVAVIELYGDLVLGDWVQFYGGQTNFVQQVASMQIERQPIESAGAGQEIAVQTVERVRRGDLLYYYYES